MILMKGIIVPIFWGANALEKKRVGEGSKGNQFLSIYSQNYIPTKFSNNSNIQK